MNQLAVFAKYWAPGQVKTRLAGRVGPARAAWFHLICLQTLLDRFRGTADAREIVFSPAERQPEFAALAGSSWRLCPQADGDLGRRMATYLQTTFSRGADRVVLVGADSPTLPLEFVSAAFALLEHQDVVVARAEDGGYCLLGARRLVPELFASVAWGNPNVWQQTRQRLESAGVRWTTIRGWFDVDHLEDLHRLRLELASPTYADATWWSLRHAARAICRHDTDDWGA